MSPREGAETSVLFPEAMSRESLNSHPMGYPIPREQWRLRCRRALRLCSIDGFGMREDGAGPIGRERCCSLATVTAGYIQGMKGPSPTVWNVPIRFADNCLVRRLCNRNLITHGRARSSSRLDDEASRRQICSRQIPPYHRTISASAVKFPQESGDRIGNRISYRLRYPLS